MKAIFAVSLLAASVVVHAETIYSFRATVDKAIIDYPSTIPLSERDFPIRVGDQFSFRILIDLNRSGGASTYIGEVPSDNPIRYHATNYPTPSNWMEYVEYPMDLGIYHSELIDYPVFGNIIADPYYVTSLIGIMPLPNRVYLVNRPFIIDDNTHSLNQWQPGVTGIPFALEMQEQHTVPFYVSGTLAITNVSSIPELNSMHFMVIGAITLLITAKRIEMKKSREPHPSIGVANASAR